jgi:hypothetical protein
MFRTRVYLVRRGQSERRAVQQETAIAARADVSPPEFRTAAFSGVEDLY